MHAHGAVLLAAGCYKMPFPVSMNCFAPQGLGSASRASDGRWRPWWATPSGWSPASPSRRRLETRPPGSWRRCRRSWLQSMRRGHSCRRTPRCRCFSTLTVHPPSAHAAAARVEQPSRPTACLLPADLAMSMGWRQYSIWSRQWLALHLHFCTALRSASHPHPQ